MKTIEMYAKLQRQDKQNLMGYQAKLKQAAKSTRFQVQILLSPQTARLHCVRIR